MHIERLLWYIDLVNSGCPVGRHELLDHEWIDLGHLKNELERLDWESRQKKGPADDA